MAKNTQPKPYDGMLLFRQNHPYTKEDFEVMKQNFQKHCGPLCPAKDEPTSFVMLGYVSRDLCGELRLTHCHPSMAKNFNLLPPDLFPEVQYGSEPLCVEIKLTPVSNLTASDVPKEQTEFQERILCNPNRPTDEEIWRDLTGEIPLKEEEEFETPIPKYKVGDQMYIKYLNMVGTIDIVMGYNEEEDGIFYHLKIEPKGVATAREEYLTPYTETETVNNKSNKL